MNIPLILLIGIFTGSLSAYVAHRREKNPYLWFTIGFLFGLLGVVAIFFLPSTKRQTVQKAEPQLIINGPREGFWYYLDASQKQQGPVSHAGLTDAWKKGDLNPTTLVWHEKLTEWKALQNFLELKE